MTLLLNFRPFFLFNFSSPWPSVSHSELESAVQILGEQVRAEKSAKAAEMEEMDKRWALCWDGMVKRPSKFSIESKELTLHWGFHK